MKPGEGYFDFAAMFRWLEDPGFAGHYMNGFGSFDNMLAARDGLVRIARQAGGAA